MERSTRAPAKNSATSAGEGFDAMSAPLRRDASAIATSTVGPAGISSKPCASTGPAMASAETKATVCPCVRNARASGSRGRKWPVRGC